MCARVLKRGEEEFEITKRLHQKMFSVRLVLLAVDNWLTIDNDPFWCCISRAHGMPWLSFETQISFLENLSITSHVVNQRRRWTLIPITSTTCWRLEFTGIDLNIVAYFPANDDRKQQSSQDAFVDADIEVPSVL